MKDLAARAKAKKRAAGGSKAKASRKPKVEAAE
jgi:hypothetical protein